MNQNILLIVSGSISCYKSYDLLRKYINTHLYQTGTICQNKVRVVLTRGALKFVKIELFSYLGAEKVYGYQDDFDINLSRTIPLHIELARWADRVVIAPASANLIADLSHGKADSLATSIFLALDKNIIKCIYPAMNTLMLENEITQQNLQKLQSISNTFIHPSSSGILLCKEDGLGKLPDIEEIFYSSLAFSKVSQNTSKNKNVLILTGATISPLDDVRYLTNPSSGKTGFYLAFYALISGYNTTVIASKACSSLFFCFSNFKNFKLLIVETTRDISSIINPLFLKCDFYFSPAAISDIEFNIVNKKINKSDLGNSIDINICPDILKQVTELKKDKPHKVIAFAAESDLSQREKLKQKITRKKADLMVVTKVFRGSLIESREGFDVDEAKYEIIENILCDSLDKNNELDAKKFKTLFDGSLSKNQLASFLIEKINLWKSNE